jgi:SNF2 family DNA or RNA helicase
MRAGLKSPVVFAWHKNVIKMVQETLEKHGYKIGRIDGSVTERRRQLAVDGFQDGSLDGIVCNIQAGGEGITLTRGSHLFMLESGFTPKDNSQPIKRIHRIGQQKHTRAEFITLAGSFDENIIGIVQDKIRAIFEIDGQRILAAPAA